jgi:hypothetical protein
MLSPLELELQMEMKQMDAERSIKQRGALYAGVPLIDLIFGMSGLAAVMVM